MNESDVLAAALGRKQLVLEQVIADHTQLNAEYTRLLSVLNGVLSGDIPKERVSIDMVDRRWTVTPEPPTEEVL